MNPQIQDVLGPRSLLRDLWGPLLDHDHPRVFVLTQVAESGERAFRLHRLGHLGVQVLWEGNATVFQLPGAFVFLPAEKTRAAEPLRMETCWVDPQFLPMRWLTANHPVHRLFEAGEIIGFLDKRGGLWRVDIDKQILLTSRLAVIPEPVIGPPIWIHPDGSAPFLMAPLAHAWFAVNPVTVRPCPEFHLRRDNRYLIKGMPLGKENILLVDRHRITYLRAGREGWDTLLDVDFPTGGAGLSRPLLSNGQLWFLDGRGTLIRADASSRKWEPVLCFHGFKPCFPCALATVDHRTIVAFDRRGEYVLLDTQTLRWRKSHFIKRSTSIPQEIQVAGGRIEAGYLYLNWGPRRAFKKANFQVEVFRWDGQDFEPQPRWNTRGKLERVFHEMGS